MLTCACPRCLVTSCGRDADGVLALEMRNHVGSLIATLTFEQPLCDEHMASYVPHSELLAQQEGLARTVELATLQMVDRSASRFVLLPFDHPDVATLHSVVAMRRSLNA